MASLEYDETVGWTGGFQDAWGRGKQAFRADRVLPAAGQEMLSDAVVLVDDQQIAGVVPAGSVPAEYRLFDLGDVCVLPCLFDLHVHLKWDGGIEPLTRLQASTPEASTIDAVVRAQAHLLNGVTTIRDVGGPRQGSVAVRDAIDNATIVGPRLLVSGNPIVMTGGHGHEVALVADGPDEVRKAARQLIAAGVDLIKVMASGGVYPRGESLDGVQLSCAEMSAAVAEAHNAGVRVAAHAHGLQAIKNAIEAGVDTIEHGCFLDGEAAGLAARAGQVLIPTLIAFQRYGEIGIGGGIPAHPVKKAAAALAAGIQAIRHARDHGLPIATGTDAGGRGKPHGCVAREIEMLVRAGMRPAEALASATTVAATACGLSNVGELRAGWSADLIAVPGNPLDDISVLTKVSTVVARGQIAKLQGHRTFALWGQNPALSRLS